MTEPPAEPVARYPSRALIYTAPSDVLLLGPGPSPVSLGVREALAEPLVGHLDPEFVDLMERVKGGLRSLFGVEHEFTIPVSGTGSAGMEMCLVNLIEPEDRVVVGVHGVFGGRIATLCERLGADVLRVEALFGQALDPAKMSAAIAKHRPALVAVVHAETSTGVLQPLEEIAAATHQADALLMVDCVTSFAGVELAFGALRVDAAFSGTQKCLSVPPGLAPLTFSERAMTKLRSRRVPCTSWYFDANLLDGYWSSGDGARSYHHTAPVGMVRALAKALDEVVVEGMAGREVRHRAVSAALIAGLDVLGLQPLVEASVRLPMLTTVVVPEGVDEAAVRTSLRGESKIEIGGGLGDLAGRVWRIGTMGEGARPNAVAAVLAGLSVALDQQRALPSALQGATRATKAACEAAAVPVPDSA